MWESTESGQMAFGKQGTDWPISPTGRHRAQRLSFAAIGEVQARIRVGSDPRNEKDHRSDRWSQKPESFSLAIAYRRQLLRADWQTAAQGLMLALRWPSDPDPLDTGLWTLVPSDAGCHRRWSLRRSSFSARDGARNPINQPTIFDSRPEQESRQPARVPT
jgi:hypothetical protein